jgi:hypothetical protein
MAQHPGIDARIAEVRSRLAANLGELHDRVNRARRLMSPRTYLDNPWIRLGLGVAAGYLVGRRRKPKLLTAGDGEVVAAAAETLVHAALRSTVMTLAAAVIERAIGQATRSDDEPARPPPIQRRRG